MRNFHGSADLQQASAAAADLEAQSAAPPSYRPLEAAGSAPCPWPSTPCAAAAHVGSAAGSVSVVSEQQGAAGQTQQLIVPVPTSNSFVPVPVQDSFIELLLSGATTATQALVSPAAVDAQQAVYQPQLQCQQLQQMQQQQQQIQQQPIQPIVIPAAASRASRVIEKEQLEEALLRLRTEVLPHLQYLAARSSADPEAASNEACSQTWGSRQPPMLPDSGCACSFVASADLSGFGLKSSGFSAFRAYPVPGKPFRCIPSPCCLHCIL